MNARLVLVGLLVVTLTLVSPIPLAQASHADATGVAVVGTSVIGAPPSPALARTFTDALLLADDSDDLGYPWIDLAHDQVVVSTTTVVGESRARQWITSGINAANPKVGFLAPPASAVRLRSVTLSFRKLEAIKNDVTRLVQAGLPDAEAIYQSEPDWENNRIVVTLSRPSAALGAALGARYGMQAVAIRVEARPVVLPATRSNDTSPFYGGAIINTGAHGCSSGFSWTDSYSNQYMMTAGHCAPLGSTNVYTPSESMGTITSGTRENWTDGTGTVYFTGDSTYRGDVALIDIYSGKSGGFFIYSAADNTTAATVHDMWTTVPNNGESYCTGGSNTYAICGWSVDHSRINYLYENGEWVLNATKGLKYSGTGINGGDSGGPVYTWNGDGTIKAKGIISGGTHTDQGPSNCYTGTPCVQIFTDILLPYYYFPGWLKTN